MVEPGKDPNSTWKKGNDLNMNNIEISTSSDGNNTDTVIAGSETEENGQQSNEFCLFWVFKGFDKRTSTKDISQLHLRCLKSTLEAAGDSFLAID